MLSLNYGLFLKPKLCYFSALVFQHTVILLLLTDSYRGQSQGVGPSQTIVAVVGQDVILPCHLEPALDAVSKSVEWGRPDLELKFVHVWHEGQDLLKNQNPSYRGRTSVSVEKLKHGDLSLKLSAVEHSDNGIYRCYFPSQSKESAVELVVGSVSSPVIAGTKLNSSAVDLQCESKGWYPEPEMLWLEGEGNLLSAVPTETVRGPDDLYTVSSRVTVEKRHSNSFTCRVQQKNINQIRVTQIHVPDDLFVVPACSVGRIIIVLVVGFMCILAVVLGAFIVRQTKTLRDNKPELGEGEKITSNNRERQSLMGSEGESSQHLKKDLSYVDREKEKLDEELEKNEGELKEVRQVLDKLENHKKDVKTNKEQVSWMLMVMIEKKMKKKNKELKTKNLAREEILKNADKLMETTDEMFIKMTEIKVRLEKDKEQVNKQLKVKQKDETQIKVQTEQFYSVELK